MGEHPGEDRVLFPNIAVGRIGKRAETLRILFVLREELHDLGRLFISRRLEEHGVNQAENGGVRSDPEREHHDGGDGETGRFPKLAKGKSKILNHMVYSVRSACMGSIRVARSAGTKQASAATLQMKSATPL